MVRPLGGPACSSPGSAGAGVVLRAGGTPAGRVPGPPAHTGRSGRECVGDPKAWPLGGQTTHLREPSERRRGLEVELCPFSGPTLLWRCLWSLRNQRGGQASARCPPHPLT